MTSFFVTLANLSIASTTSCGVGTKMTSGERSGCCAEAGTTTVVTSIARSRKSLRAVMSLLHRTCEGGIIYQATGGSLLAERSNPASSWVRGGGPAGREGGVG